MLINVKMPTIVVGILTFISMINTVYESLNYFSAFSVMSSSNFMLSLVEQESSFITSGPWSPKGVALNTQRTARCTRYRKVAQGTAK